MKLLKPIVLLAALSSTLIGCAPKEELTIIRIGASSTPHAEILEHVAPLLEEQGYRLVITEFQDYVLPNLGVTNGELDANYFQHIPYLNYYNETNNTTIVNAGGIHIEPIGIYSQAYTDLASLPNGTRVIMSNSVSDRGRLLGLLVEAGLITLNEGVDPYTDTITDISSVIATNPKLLTFEADIDAGLLVQAYQQESNCIVLINTNYALIGELSPLEDALVLESASQDNPYVNIIAVAHGDEDDEGIQALVSVLLSDEVRTWILSQYDGAVVPASLAD